MTDEKRKEKRVKQDFSILCRIYERTELESDVSKIFDISKSGVCFFTDTPCEKNNIVQLIFRIPPDFREKVEVFGRIVEAQHTFVGYKTRVSFIGIPPDVEAGLEKIIAHAGPGEKTPE